MTGTRCMGAATAGPRMVVDACGLLAPFNDAGALSPLDVHAATAIARLWGETGERVLLAAALAVRGTRFGHVCIDVSNQREALVVEGQPPEVVDALPWPDSVEWASAVRDSPMVGDGRGEEPLVHVGGRLYLERYFRYEELLFDLIEARALAPEADLDPEVRVALDQLLPPLAEGGQNLQHAAGASALAGKLTVIAGGPGTGKTYTVAKMLEALAHLPGTFPRVALCAPTGKAAARLKEVVEEHAARTDKRVVAERLGSVENSTIHRLLGFSRERGRFAHDERNPLPHDMVIVDEMSMVSLPLAAKLMSAVRMDASLVLAGDPYQLESIEAGTVLSDIVGPAADSAAAGESVAPASIAGRVVILERVHRFEEQGSIADFAGAVRDGVPEQAVALLDLDVDALHWVRNRSGSDFRRLTERVLDHRVRLVEKASQPGNEEAALAELGSLAVLCAHREGPGSVEQWRRDIEDALDRRFPGLRYGGEWYPGRPLMITANDYNLGLYNGDIGVVVQTDDGLRVVFERGGPRMFPPGYLSDHATVHALTIHKSQGSQFGEVVVSLPSESSRLLTRELLYTAVTRASRRVTVVGEEPVIRMAVERSVQRASGLRSRLWTSGTS